MRENETGDVKEKDGKTSCNSSGDRQIGTNRRGTEAFGKIMLRPSSCSGLTTADKVKLKERCVNCLIGQY